MSLIRSIEAKFVAQARGLKSTIQGVKKDINKLFIDTKKASNSANKSFSNSTRNFANHVQKFSAGAQKQFESAGNTLIDYSNRLQKASNSTRDYGRSITRKLTLPVVGAITAVGGLTTALGFKRLVGLDSAQAKLKGLGYNAKDVERISKQVETAIEGGMTTMGEGVDIAAGGLAAGVKEGKDLERYIRLVGDAAIGSNRPVGEMAQIFNRVQGQGKLMTQELNMIEQGLPGFAQAMADDVAGGSLEAFRDMVTNGEVGSKEFLDVMDDFAGGMAEAYSESWAGMAKNTLAYVGIIGESMLEGAFEEGKKSLAEFIELLKSDEVQAWAKRVGEMIRVIFTEVVEKVKSGVEWFRNLSNSQQRMIVKLGALAIAIGPILLALGTFGNLISSILKPLGYLSLGLGKVSGVVGKVAGAFGKGGLQGVITAVGNKLPWLGRLFTLLTGPVGIAIGVITTLATIFTVAYKKSETFRDFIDQLGEKLKEVFFGIVDWMRPGLDAVLSFFGEIKLKISEFISQDGAQLTDAFKNIGSIISTVAGAIGKAVSWAFNNVVKPVIEFVMPFIEGIIKMVWGNIKGIITGALDVIMGAVKIFSGLFTGDFSKMWEGVQQLFSGAVKFIWNLIQLHFVGRILKIAGTLVKTFTSLLRGMWTKVTGIFTKSVTGIFNAVRTGFTKILNTIRTINTSINNVITKIWNFILNKIKSIVTSLFNAVRSIFTKLFNTIRSINTNIRNTMSNIWNALMKRIKSIATSLWNGVRNTFNQMRTGLTNLVTRTKNGIVNGWKNIKSSVSNLAKGLWTSVKKWFDKIVGGAKELPKRMGDGFRSAKKKATDAMKSVGNGVIEWAGKPFNKVISGVNWITSKLGIKKNIDPWPIPKYAHGTKRAHPGGLAQVNDGRGHLSGRELISLPDGTTGMFKGKDVVANLPKGTHVFSAPDTKSLFGGSIPKYNRGTDSTRNFLGKGSNVTGGSAKKRTWKEKVWDYIKNPSKLLNIALDKFKAVLPSNITPTFKDMIKGGYNTVKKAALDKVKSTFKKQEKTEHNPNYMPTGGMLLGASAGSRKVTNRWGVHDYLYNIARHIMQSPLGRGLIITSGYRSTSNTDHGKRNAIDLSGFGRNGGYGRVARWASRLPRVSYTIGDNVVYGRKYGDGGRPGWARGHMNHLHVSGYKDGGIINTKQLAWIAEGGWAESIISHDPAKYNSQKAIWQKTGDALGFTDDKGNKEILAKLERIAKAVEQDKEFVVNMDSKQVGELVEQHVTHKQTRRSRRKRRASN